MTDKIKSLREKTGAGMVDCKKALDESAGDLEKAVEILRKKGIAKASKREDREANEGVVKVDIDKEKNKAYILEINSETDFVSRSGKFKDFTEEVFSLIKSGEPKNLDELMEIKMSDGNSVKDNLNNLSGVIGEKLGVKRFNIIASAGTVAAYSHSGGRIGAIVSLDKREMDDLAYEMAMQIAAANPKYINREQVPEADLAKEKEIYREQLIKEGKPEQMIEKILPGKMNKYFEEICLVDQEFIKDDKKKIRDVLGDAGIESLVRYSL
ncbi:MAG: translation elongation factor Ts [Patescibacteria group bacterium]|jgi:elongation factor Ts